MKSYIISVSAGTGCYRHIQISASASLHKLHKVISHAFDLEDHHAHAFFMDNRYGSECSAYFSLKKRGDERLTTHQTLEGVDLSRGKKFKYVFGSEDARRFQCKVLRELEEDTKHPGTIRRVGNTPKQPISRRFYLTMEFEFPPDVSHP